MLDFIVDFSAVKRQYHIHEVLKESLRFPDYYGENLDALWDCLTEPFGEPVLIKLRGTTQIPNDLHDYMSRVLEVFSDAAKKMDTFHYEVVS